MKKILPSAALLISSAVSAQNQKPNVIFIAIDDLRDFVGYFGTNTDVKTPNIDRLAARGVAFTNAHVQAPFSAPSRNSLLTGMLPSSTGAYDFQPYDSVDAFKDISPLPQHFRENEYYVAGTGKIFHNSDWSILKKAFDVFYTETENAVWNQTEKVTNPKENIAVDKGHFNWGPTNQPDSILEEVKRTDFIIGELQKRHLLPFFLGIGYIKPHLPFIAPRRFFNMYPLANIKPRPILDGDLSDISDAGRSFIYYNDEITIRQKQYQKQILQAYYACISYVDEQIGRLLDALDKSRYANNTIIVLWTDNGWHFGEKRSWRKFTLWQESTRVPLIIVPAGGTNGAKCNRPVQLLDIYPTLVKMCGIPGPDHNLEGNDLSDLIANPEMEWKHPCLLYTSRCV